MTFEERKALALAGVVEFLARMSPPRGMSEDAQEVVMGDIAAALARKMAVGTEAQFVDDLAKTFSTVSDNHKTWAWPTPGEFVAGIPPRQRSMAPAPETFMPGSPHDEMAKRMRANIPAPESYIWGRMSQQMLNSGDTTRNIMDGYRRGSVAAHRAIYRDGAEKILTDRYGDIVTPYFRT